VKLLWAVPLVLCYLTNASSSAPLGAPLGKETIGFRVEWITDHTRSWQDIDAEGNAYEAPRVVRVHLWYPAVGTSGRAMTLRDYFEPRVPIGVPALLSQAIHDNDVGNPESSFRGIYGRDSTAYARALATPVAARAGATPAPGKHPVVIYSVGQNDFSQDAVALAEWLASTGYIVASVPHLGSSPRRALLFVHDPVSYETQLRDLEVALAQALELPGADENRVLAIGHSYGGIYALLLAMRNHTIRGVVGLDPTYVAQRAGYEYDLRKFPFFDPELSVPVVTLRRGSGAIDSTLLVSLTHAEQLEVVYPQLMHGDFATVPFLRRDLPAALQRDDEVKVRSPELAAEGANAVFHQVHAAAAAILAGRRLDSAELPADAVRHEAHYRAATSAPTSETLYWIYKRRGLEEARSVVTAAGGQRVFSEPRMLTIARELGYSGKDQESLDMFQLVATTFPDSASAQLEAGRALLGAGRKTEARAYLEQAVRLDPANASARESLEKATH
jgi:dienelactone hydrolase